MNTVDTLRVIYNRYRKKFRSNPDSDQILAIENKFDVELSEDDAMEIYDMDVIEAVNKIEAIKQAQC
jgi:hypothetical protein